MTGLVKDRAWAYENEVRLRVNVQDYEEYEQIAVEVPEFVVQSITMMTGPRFTGNIEDITKAYNIQVNQSLFTNKLAWIPCDDCEDVKAKAE